MWGSMTGFLSHPALPLSLPQCRGRNPFDPKVSAMNSVFDRALVFMHKMPTIWLEFLKFLVPQRRITSTRRTFDRALQALPVTQHEKIWPLYIQVRGAAPVLEVEIAGRIVPPVRSHVPPQFCKDAGVTQTCIRVFRRFLMFSPAGREEYADYLLATGNADEAAVQVRRASEMAGALLAVLSLRLPLPSHRLLRWSTTTASCRSAGAPSTRCGCSSATSRPSTRAR